MAFFRHSFLILLFAGVLVLGLTQTVQARDYGLEIAQIDVFLYENGSMYVQEDIGYWLEGCYSELFRTHNIHYGYSSDQPYLESVDGSCDPDCRIIDKPNELAGNFGTICDQNPTLFVDSHILNGVVLGQDVAELHYKIWGEDWEKTLGTLQGSITLPISTDKVDVFFNPYQKVSYTTQDNIIFFEAFDVYNYIEVRLLLPLDVFTGEHTRYDPTLTRAKSLKIQQDYERNFNLYFYLMLGYIFLFTGSFITIPLLLFHFYGREPIINYQGIFEREPIKGMKPYIINSLVMGSTGHTDHNAIIATLMDLVRRNHIKVADKKITKKFFGPKKDLVFTFTGNRKDKLSKPEKIVYDYYHGLSENGTLIWSHYIKTLKKQSNAREYTYFSKDFDIAVHKEYNLVHFFDKKGDTYFKIFAAGLIFLNFFSLGGFTLLNFSNYPYLVYTYPLFGIVFIVGFVSFFISNRIMGRFTPKGYEIYLKSKNFRKFMTDMTSLKEHPPASIVLWEYYLVYATTFGVADTVIRYLKVSVPDSRVRTSPMRVMYTSYAVTSLARASSVSASTLSTARGASGGGGGVGGGFGGGGGGAR